MIAKNCAILRIKAFSTALENQILAIEDHIQTDQSGIMLRYELKLEWIKSEKQYFDNSLESLSNCIVLDRTLDQLSCSYMNIRNECQRLYNGIIKLSKIIEAAG